MDLKTFQAYFEPQFKKLLDEKITGIKAVGAHKNIQNLFEYTRELAQNGKRFRPFLFYSAYKEYGGTLDIFPYLASVELLHIFALVHDDIMDESNTRHGVLTAHTYFFEYYKKNTDEIISKKISTSQAILLGDLIFSWSQELMSDNIGINPEAYKKMLQGYHTLIKEVIIGQAMDVDFSVSLPKSYEEILVKTALKSGHYSIMHPLLLGGYLANVKQPDIDWITYFGHQLGNLFQIQDDLLDCTKTSIEIGKPAFNDTKSRQQTLISWFMLNKVTSEQKQLFQKFYGKTDLTSAEENNLKNLFISAGAIHFIEDEIAKIQTNLEKHIQEKENGHLWMQILQTITKRSH